MLNPFTLRAFWWAAVLLTLSGVGLSFYAGRLVEEQSMRFLQERAGRVARAIEKSPDAVPAIVASAGGAVTVFDSQFRILAASGGTEASGTSDSQILRSVLDQKVPRTVTGQLAEAIVPVSAAGSPAALVRIAEPADEVLASANTLKLRLLGLTGVFTLFGMAAVALYLNTAEHRVRQQRRFVEGVLSSGPATTVDEDEIGALARSLRDLPPRLEGLNRQAQSELTLRELILKTMSEGIVAVDREMHVTFGNENFALFAGAKGPVAVGAHILTFVRLPEFVEAMAGAIREGVSNRLRIELSGRRLEIQTTPLSGGAIAVFRDVTELERLERVRRDFITNISHELRTPLASIQGYAETLLEGTSQPGALERQFLETIHRHALRLSHVAADLATLSEIEGASPSEPLGPLSLRLVVSSAVRAVEQTAESRGVLLIAGEVPDIEVAGHLLRFEQALTNLLDNAVRFNHSGGEVILACDLLPSDEVSIAIGDNGLGIPSEHVHRIFERFYRVDKARSRETGGTGLGLSIVKHVAEQMHGRVTVESQLGRGSKFTIIVPVERSSVKQVEERAAGYVGGAP